MTQHHKNDIPPAPNPDLHPRPHRQFTIRSVMLITIIMAVGAAGFGRLMAAANGDLADIGPFIVVTAMAPLGVMIVISWFFRFFKKL